MSWNTYPLELFARTKLFARRCFKYARNRVKMGRRRSQKTLAAPPAVKAEIKHEDVYAYISEHYSSMIGSQTRTISINQSFGHGPFVQTPVYESPSPLSFNIVYLIGLCASFFLALAFAIRYVEQSSKAARAEAFLALCNAVSAKDTSTLPTPTTPDSPAEDEFDSTPSINSLETPPVACALERAASSENEEVDIALIINAFGYPQVACAFERAANALYEAEIQELHKLILQAESEKARESHDAEIEELGENHAIALKELKDKLQDTNMRYSKHMQQKDAVVENMKKSAAAGAKKEVELGRQLREVTISRDQARHSLNAANQANQIKVAALEAELDKASIKANEAIKAAQTNAESKANKAIEIINKKHARELQNFEKTHADVVSDFETRLESKDKEISDFEALVKSKDEEIDGLGIDASFSKDDVDELQAEKTKLQVEVAKLAKDAQDSEDKVVKLSQLIQEQVVTLERAKVSKAAAVEHAEVTLGQYKERTKNNYDKLVEKNEEKLAKMEAAHADDEVKAKDRLKKVHDRHVQEDQKVKDDHALEISKLESSIEKLQGEKQGMQTWLDRFARARKLAVEEFAAQGKQLKATHAELDRTRKELAKECEEKATTLENTRLVLKEEYAVKKQLDDQYEKLQKEVATLRLRISKLKAKFGDDFEDDIAPSDGADSPPSPPPPPSFPPSPPHSGSDADDGNAAPPEDSSQGAPNTSSSDDHATGAGESLEARDSEDIAASSNQDAAHTGAAPEVANDGEEPVKKSKKRPRRGGRKHTKRRHVLLAEELERLTKAAEAGAFVEENEEDGEQDFGEEECDEQEFGDEEIREQEVKEEDVGEEEEPEAHAGLTEDDSSKDSTTPPSAQVNATGSDGASTSNTDVNPANVVDDPIIDTTPPSAATEVDNLSSIAPEPTEEEAPLVKDDEDEIVDGANVWGDEGEEQVQGKKKRKKRPNVFKKQNQKQKQLEDIAKEEECVAEEAVGKQEAVNEQQVDQQEEDHEPDTQADDTPIRQRKAHRCKRGGQSARDKMARWLLRQAEENNGELGASAPPTNDASGTAETPAEGSSRNATTEESTNADTPTTADTEAPSDSAAVVEDTLSKMDTAALPGIQSSRYAPAAPAETPVATPIATPATGDALPIANLVAATPAAAAPFAETTTNGPNTVASDVNSSQVADSPTPETAAATTDPINSSEETTKTTADSGSIFTSRFALSAAEAAAVMAAKPPYIKSKASQEDEGTPDVAVPPPTIATGLATTAASSSCLAVPPFTDTAAAATKEPVATAVKTNTTTSGGVAPPALITAATSTSPAHTWELPKTTITTSSSGLSRSRYARPAAGAAATMAATPPRPGSSAMASTAGTPAVVALPLNAGRQAVLPTTPASVVASPTPAPQNTPTPPASGLSGSRYAPSASQAAVDAPPLIPTRQTAAPATAPALAPPTAATPNATVTGIAGSRYARPAAEAAANMAAAPPRSHNTGNGNIAGTPAMVAPRDTLGHRTLTPATAPVVAPPTVANPNTNRTGIAGSRYALPAAEAMANMAANPPILRSQANQDMISTPPRGPRRHGAGHPPKHNRRRWN